MAIDEMLKTEIKSKYDAEVARAKKAREEKFQKVKSLGMAMKELFHDLTPQIISLFLPDDLLITVISDPEKLRYDASLFYEKVNYSKGNSDGQFVLEYYPSGEKRIAKITSGIFYIFEKDYFHIPDWDNQIDPAKLVPSVLDDLIRLYEFDQSKFLVDGKPRYRQGPGHLVPEVLTDLVNLAVANAAKVPYESKIPDQLIT